ncbi:uncharacterized protein [uncultured Mediterranean phage uvMED]|nr:uncharacterized protein [uncultured Mediterranean phage uvMED]BAR21609.1 uncharacterized protein [uncultured Mediterranean phage uvMED]BAR21621.1 uncharacterized protein [uncultured Mediterranean phage uvMED]BAR21634.1 uncharacterized protein [uncultured Mediterranean phage uvMED]BAR21691.1 uncharacterized protein [uncultured Mediterranean phage uvMED]|tara:strand:- start:46 stop:582 length:537 start_codon:yes stop_codon:yes gene_type:complete
MSQLKVNSIVPVGGLPSGASGGGVIQTVQHVKTDYSSFTVNSQSSYDDTNFAASITPTSTAHKILVTIMVNHAASSDQMVGYALRCNGSNVNDSYGAASGSKIRATGSYHASNSSYHHTVHLQFLHSPASTSAQSYNLRWNHNSSSNRTHYINGSASGNDNYTNFRCASTIVLQEITN